MMNLGYLKYEDKGVCLYNAKTHKHYINTNEKIHFDIVCGLFYHSLDQRQYIPIDSTLQKNILYRKIEVSDFWVFQPAPEDEIIHLCCHCIFDKNLVNFKYKNRIETLFDTCDHQYLLENLRLAFFNFAPVAFELIKEKETDLMYKKYITFTGY